MTLPVTSDYVAFRTGSCICLAVGLAELMTSGFQCAGCGEWNETVVDASVGMRQSYVEDCQVCCKPNVLHVVWDSESDEYVVSAELE
jgi:hypothetical protein